MDSVVVSRRFSVAGRQQSGSGRQGRSPVGESPTVSIARFGHVAISQFMMVVISTKSEQVLGPRMSNQREE